MGLNKGKEREEKEGKDNKGGVRKGEGFGTRVQFPSFRN